MKITDYRILAALNSNEMSELVREAIEDGWEPIGGLAFNNNAIGQALVKYDRSQQDQIAEQINDIHSTQVLDLASFLQNWRDLQSYPRAVTVQK